MDLMNMIQFEEIKKAEQALKNVVKHTPVEHSRIFSELTGNNIYLKLENLQTTGSFKLRGAYYRLKNLTPEEKKSGVVASSAGNHAQGVAYSANSLGISSTIFMPIFTPPMKVIATKSYGAEVRLVGNTYDDAYREAIAFANNENKKFIHPFNDELLIAGQGTIGIEIFEQIKDLDAVLVPIGGGGLISGIALALKSLNKNIRVIGVEAEGAQSMKISVEQNQIIPLKNLDTIADGIAVKTPGDITFELVKKYVDELVSVSDAEISRAIYMLLSRGKIIAEPAGAVTLAALLSGKINLKNKNICALISGGNINLSLLTQIIEKGLTEEKLLTRVSMIIPDQPGALKDILNFISNLKANVQSIEGDRLDRDVPVGMVKIIITLQTLGTYHITSLEKFFSENNIKYEIIS
ncbi:MAG: threonine ammonia-lyase [Thermoplasmata archaeon]